MRECGNSGDICGISKWPQKGMKYEMAIDSADIEAYMQATGQTQKMTARRIREVLGIFSTILDERGIPRPDAEAYEALRAGVEAQSR